MNSKPKQLPLALPHRQALGREDFLVTASNAAAVALIDQWPNWTSYGAIIVGPEGSGKSHLAEVWRQKSGANLCNVSDVHIETVLQLLSTNALAINVDGHMNERAVFHLCNAAKQNGHSLLFTTGKPVANWNLTLPDLVSRLNSLPLVAILPPDDELLRGVLLKLFDDRQIALDEQTLNYLMLRMPRSLQAARTLVAAIDHQAMVEKAAITRPFVARVLSELINPDLFEADT